MKEYFLKEYSQKENIRLLEFSMTNDRKIFYTLEVYFNSLKSKNYVLILKIYDTDMKKIKTLYEIIHFMKDYEILDSDFKLSYSYENSSSNIFFVFPCFTGIENNITKNIIFYFNRKKLLFYQLTMIKINDPNLKLTNYLGSFHLENFYLWTMLFDSENIYLVKFLILGERKSEVVEINSIKLCLKGLCSSIEIEKNGQNYFIINPLSNNKYYILSIRDYVLSENSVLFYAKDKDLKKDFYKKGFLYKYKNYFLYKEIGFPWETEKGERRIEREKVFDINEILYPYHRIRRTRDYLVLKKNKIYIYFSMKELKENYRSMRDEDKEKIFDLLLIFSRLKIETDIKDKILNYIF